MTDYKPPYRSSVVAGLSVFLLYVLTLSPSTAMWDTSEYIATAYILGIPHPPGNPLFVALGRSWSVLLSPFGLPVAVRINLLAAATSALAAGFYFLIAHRILWGFFRGPGQAALKAGDAAAEPPPSWIPSVGAGVSVLLSAAAFTVWNQSTVNEKVYTVSVAILTAVLWCAIRWRDRSGEAAGVRWLLAAFYILALGSTNHLMSVLPAPALALFVLWVAPAVLLRRSFWIRAVPLVLLGLSFNFFLPIRAELDPVINEGDPTCESVGGAVAAVYTNGKAGCENLSRVLSRFQYQKPPLSERQATFGQQLLNYYQYFDWQWGRGLDPSEQPFGGRTPVTLAFLLLGLWGLWVVWRADRDAFVLLGTLALTVTLGLVIYLNFKYGYSLAPEVASRDLHEVRERDYFFIASFGLWGVLAGLGLTALWRRTWLSLSGTHRPLKAAPVLAIALLPLAFNWVWASRAGDYATRDWAYNLLMSVEPYGVIFTNGDNDTFPLWYVQEVEGVRQDVTVVVGQYLYTDWYPRQLQDLTQPGRQRPFLPDQGGGLYTAPADPPSRPIITLSPDDMDAVYGGSISEAMPLALGDVVVRYPAGTSFDRGDWLTLRMILDSLGERPVYFATPSGILGRLGLSPWAVRHALAAKLVPRDLDSDSGPDLVKAADGFGAEWFDVPRSLQLMTEVYSYRGFRDRKVWTDRSSLNIPWYFYATSLQLADAVSRWDGASGAEIEFLRDAASSFLVTAQGGSLAVRAPADG